MRPIHAGKIVVMASVLAVAAASHQGLVNPGFEASELTGWVTFSSTTERSHITLETNTVAVGKQALLISAQGVAKSYQGIFQSLPVVAGTVYLFTISVRPVTIGSARGQISIEWKDAQGKEIRRDWGPDWTTPAVKTDWVAFQIRGTAPATAHHAHFVITQFDPPEAGSKGAFLVDDASVAQN